MISAFESLSFDHDAHRFSARHSDIGGALRWLVSVDDGAASWSFAAAPDVDVPVGVQAWVLDGWKSVHGMAPASGVPR